MPRPPSSDHGVASIYSELEQLDTLYALLESHQWGIDARQWASVHNLIVRLQAEQRLPENIEAFESLLAPLLCTHQEQQQRFSEIFHEWLEGFRSKDIDDNGPNGPIPPVPTPPGPGGDDTGDDDPPGNKNKKSYLRIVLLFSVFAALSIVTLFLWNTFDHQTTFLGDSPIATPELISDKLSETGVSSSNLEIETPQPTITPVATPKPKLQQYITPINPIIADESNSAWWRASLLILPWLVFLISMLRVKHQQTLKRSKSSRQHPLRYLGLKSLPSMPFAMGLLGPIGKFGGSVPSSALDDKKSVDETLKHLEKGFVQVYQQRRTAIEYLVLVDRPHRADHVSVLADRLIQNLKDQHFEVSCYDYYKSPLRCYYRLSIRQPAQTKGISLSELRLRYSHARLIVIGDSQSVFHPLTQVIHPWAKSFEAWATRIWLLPQAQPWGVSQKKLAQTGFLMTPFTTSGFSAVTQWLHQQTREQRQPQGAWFSGFEEEGFPALIHRGESWLSEDESNSKEKKQQVTKLFSQLRDYLGDKGWTLLCACAAYPEVHGQLTLALDIRLFPDSSSHEREQRLLKLSRLPWFQRGSMPQYLRILWLYDLSSDLFKKVSEILCDLIQEKAEQDSTGLSTPIDLQKPSTNQPKAKIDPKVLEKTQDVLLLKVLNGRRSRVDFVLPDEMARLFRNKTVQWSEGGKRALVAFVVTLALWGGFESVRWFLPEQDESVKDIPVPAMVEIPSGTFTMGCLSNDNDCLEGELPPHEVSISAFEMSATEVTFEQYDFYCDQVESCERPEDEGWGRGDRPVINVSWNDTQAYIQWLNEQTGKNYRLPTEAEWEYAARADTQTKYSWGNEPSGEFANGDDRDGIGNWPKDGYEDTSPVGNYKPNPWGLYDMHGNVDEWVQDRYDFEYYKNSPSQDPAGPSDTSISDRVLRGGSWSDDAQGLRSALRLRFGPTNRNGFTGFRLSLGGAVLTPSPEPSIPAQAVAQPPVLPPEAKSVLTPTPTPLCYQLWLEDLPPKVKIRLPEIAPSYTPGMCVEPQRLLVEIKADGYLDFQERINLTSQNQRISPELVKLTPAPTPSPTATPVAENNSKIPLPKMISIPAGRFKMGCLSNDSDCSDDEKPVHEVAISAFKISATEVTFEQYDFYCEQVKSCERPRDEGWGRGNRPVINVSWNDAQAYIRWLNQETGKKYRLPTEAEWEYAARAGTQTKYSWGDESSGEYANGGDDYGGWPKDGHDQTAPVGSYKPNLWGLYDMHGNVWEWVQDRYDSNYYERSPSQDPAGPSDTSISFRVLRGGSWVGYAQFLRSAFRLRFWPDGRDDGTGFRLSLGE